MQDMNAVVSFITRSTAVLTKCNWFPVLSTCLSSWQFFKLT